MRNIHPLFRESALPSILTHILFQVSRQFAACILLPDNTKASISAVSVLPKAKFVSVEPISEEDWEVLELNSDLAEEAILKQVRTCWLLHLNLLQVFSPN
jgi:hypothetical protein